MRRSVHVLAIVLAALVAACSDVKPALERADQFMQRTTTKVIGEEAAASASASPTSAAPSGDQGLSPEAAYRLGIRHLNGEGVAKDERRAAELLESAAARGHRDAQYLLAVTHAQKDLAAYDPARARSWFARAGEGGHPLAAYRLAVIYAEGHDVAKEPAWAAVWFRRAAERGHADAAFTLGLNYIAGSGVPRDDVEAYRWLAVAERAKHREAARYREALERRMSESDIETARQNPPPALKPMTTARIPDEAIVRFVQHALRITGNEPGAIDGKMGASTRAALAAYRKKKGLPPEAVLSSATVEAMRADLRGRG